MAVLLLVFDGSWKVVFLEVGRALEGGSCAFLALLAAGGGLWKEETEAFYSVESYQSAGPFAFLAAEVGSFGRLRRSVVTCFMQGQAQVQMDISKSIYNGFRAFGCATAEWDGAADL